ncbi:hypothetical protein A3759_07940 [Thalassolituus sp. HI0120]|nr:hypothetical protein A3759_07940 [Thalassolituus sp. HI0120]
MTSAAVLSALESNRRYTDFKDAKSRLGQARRDLEARVIDDQEYHQIAEDCLKIIRSSENHQHDASTA